MILSINNLSLYYQDKKKEKEYILEDASICFSSGNLNILEGASGTGKTSLLNAIAGTSRQYEGEISFDGKKLSSYRNPYSDILSYVTADKQGIPELTVHDFLSLVSKEEVRIQKVLSLLNLTELGNQKISLCSRGEEARTAIAATLLKDTPFLLLDEPTAHLDQKNKATVFSVLKEYSKNHLVLIASHDFRFLSDKDYSQYSIQDKTIRLSSAAAILPGKEKDFAREKDVPSAKTQNKFALSLSIRHKVSFVLSVLLMSFSLIGSFVSATFSSIDKDATYNSLLDYLPNQYVELSQHNGIPFQDIEDGFLTSTMRLNGVENQNTVPFTCVEELQDPFRKNVQAFFDSFDLPDTHFPTDNKRYYPIVVTDELTGYLKEKTNKENEVGDLLPVDLCDYSSPLPPTEIQDSFVIAGIIPYTPDRDSSMQEEASVNPSSFFPCLIRKTDYISCLRNTGIRSSVISDSLEDLMKKYLEYCSQNGLKTKLDDASFDYSHLLRYSDYKDRMVPYSSGSDSFAYRRSLSDEETIAYTGDFPTEKNWIMLPEEEDRSAYLGSLLTPPSNPASREGSSFFLPYEKDSSLVYPLCQGSSPLSYPIDGFTISGIYLKKDKNITMSGCLLVSDDLYDSLLSQIENGAKDRVLYETGYGNKAFLKNHSASLKDGTLLIVSPTFANGVNAYKNSLASARFYSYVSLAVALVSLLLSGLYVMNLNRDSLHDIAILKLLGRSPKKIVLFKLSTFLPLLLLSLVIGLPFSSFAAGSLLSLTAANSHFSGRLVPANGFVPYLIELSVLLGFAIFLYLISLIPPRKKETEQIKEDD